MRLKRTDVDALNLAGAMFWELSNDDGTLLDARRSGLGLSAPPIRSSVDAECDHSVVRCRNEAMVSSSARSFESPESTGSGREGFAAPYERGASFE